MVHVSTLRQETSRTSLGWTAFPPSRWPFLPVFSHIPCLIMSPRTFKSLHVCLLQVRVEKDKVIIRANKQVTRKEWGEFMQRSKLIKWLISDLQKIPGPSVSEEVKADGSMLSGHQFQHRVQPCSHHWLRSACLCTTFSIFRFSNNNELHWIHFREIYDSFRFLNVIFHLCNERLCRSCRSCMCRDAEARGLHRPHRHVHHGQTSSVWQA